MPRRSEPTAEVHGYSDHGGTPVGWSTGRDAVRDAEVLWISTVRPDGRPSTSPVVAVWHDDALWFTTSAHERKARTLAENPHCTLATTHGSPSADLDVVLEGPAERIADHETLRTFVTAFTEKYGTDPWDLRAVEGGVVHDDPATPGIRPIEFSVFRVHPVLGAGFRHGVVSSQTTWDFTR
ncbi:pyridoxamine 5'-phosphate oxidase family protein [Patulibacter sp.]|uniref:pyridoxamine 5'-phosphate oxidase family protein n=1 Tax=Patulibacter sp. TaxID=1912859 RepID=UPI002717385E|nr:pyridoxamine 5'-phosphate oxidase family protein [Patulibacter sp.]MDO9408984.1 pyridoxamine 5'-phosphate oxidase family protein [Patulibacter sp.]